MARFLESLLEFCGIGEKDDVFTANRSFRNYGDGRGKYKLFTRCACVRICRPSDVPASETIAISQIIRNTLLAVGLISLAALCCLDVYVITTKMAAFSSSAGLGWFSHVSALFGSQYLAPRLAWLIIIPLMVRGIRLPLAALIIITGVLGWNQGFWQYETIDYIKYEPEKHFKPSGWALLVSICINVGLIVWGGLCLFAGKFLNKLARRIAWLLCNKRTYLFPVLFCCGVLASGLAYEMPFRSFLNSTGLYWAGFLIIAGIFSIYDSAIRFNKDFVAVTWVLISADITVLVWLSLVHMHVWMIFGYNWNVHYMNLNLIIGFGLPAAVGLLAFRDLAKRRRAMAARRTTEVA